MTENVVKLTKMSKTNKKATLEEKLTTLQSHFGAIISTVKDLKCNVEDLKRKFVETKMGDVKEIIETQRVIDEVVVANSDAIKQLKSEFRQMKCTECAVENDKGTAQNEDAIKEILEKQKGIDESIFKNSDSIKIIDEEIKNIVSEKNQKDMSKQEIDAAINKLNEEIQRIKERNKEHKPTEEISPVSDKSKKKPRCKYFNVGYCKYKMNCKFTHTTKVCQDNVGGKCEDNKCPKRHPKICKWFTGSSGCRRNKSCEFSHDTLVSDDVQHFKCVSCKHDWNERRFVVRHEIQGMELYFCLNCDDWVKYKDRVLDDGWSLFDRDGHLNHLV